MRAPPAPLCHSRPLHPVPLTLRLSTDLWPHVTLSTGTTDTTQQLRTPLPLTTHHTPHTTPVTARTHATHHRPLTLCVPLTTHHRHHSATASTTASHHTPCAFPTPARPAGQGLQVTGTYFSSNNTIVVVSLEVTQPSSGKDFVVNGTHIAVKSITMFFDVCGVKTYPNIPVSHDAPVAQAAGHTHRGRLFIACCLCFWKGAPHSSLQPPS